MGKRRTEPRYLDRLEIDRLRAHLVYEFRPSPLSDYGAPDLLSASAVLAERRLRKCKAIPAQPMTTRAPLTANSSPCFPSEAAGAKAEINPATQMMPTETRSPVGCGSSFTL